MNLEQKFRNYLVCLVQFIQRYINHLGVNDRICLIYKRESKVLQYFVDVRHDSVGPDTFAKVTNHIGMRDVELV